jgi:hypothetical protein
MAKRTRYPNRTARRNAKRDARSAAAPSSPRPPLRPSPADAPIPVDLPDDEPILASGSSLTEAEINRAAELEAEANARERAAIAESLRRSRTEEREYHAGDVNAPLSVRAAHEYAYVARDVKRIALTASLMIGILAVLYVLTNVLGVITL